MSDIYSHIIWDWNGTLFDDAGWCLTVVNNMLSKRNMKPFGNISEYRAVFSFPIIDYYKNIGFDFEKEPFEKLAEEFILLYHSKRTGYCTLHKNAQSALKTLHEKNKFQIILSASEINNLISQVNQFDIFQYFDEILGISNIYAKSKIDVGIGYMTRKNVKNAILIGDTEHDFEAAKALGADCILISNGHQNRDKLLSCKVPVLNDISQIIEYFT